MGAWGAEFGGSLRRQLLKMGKDGNFLCVETILDKFLFYEPAGSEELIDAFLVGSQPAMEIGFGHQQQPGTRGSGVTTLGENVSELSATTALARLSFRDQIVGGAKQLEVVQVIEHGDALCL